MGLPPGSAVWRGLCRGFVVCCCPLADQAEPVSPGLRPAAGMPAVRSDRAPGRLTRAVVQGLAQGLLHPRALRGLCVLSSAPCCCSSQLWSSRSAPGVSACAGSGLRRPVCARKAEVDPRCEFRSWTSTFFFPYCFSLFCTVLVKDYVTSFLKPYVNAFLSLPFSHFPIPLPLSAIDQRHQ